MLTSQPVATLININGSGRIRQRGIPPFKSSSPARPALAAEAMEYLRFPPVFIVVQNAS
jgi:hypothetical protein